MGTWVWPYGNRYQGDRFPSAKALAGIERRAVPLSRGSPTRACPMPFAVACRCLRLPVALPAATLPLPPALWS